MRLTHWFPGLKKCFVYLSRDGASKAFIACSRAALNLCSVTVSVGFGKPFVTDRSVPL